jgi:hypothetical protein
MDLEYVPNLGIGLILNIENLQSTSPTMSKDSANFTLSMTVSPLSLFFLLSNFSKDESKDRQGVTDGALEGLEELLLLVVDAGEVVVGPADLLEGSDELGVALLLLLLPLVYGKFDVHVEHVVQEVVSR